MEVEGGVLQAQGKKEERVQSQEVRLIFSLEMLYFIRKNDFSIVLFFSI